MGLPLLNISKNEKVSVNTPVTPTRLSRPPYGLTFAIFLIVLLFFSLPLAEIPFSSHGEAREAVVVQNMTQQHSYILPLRNGADIPSKPPGFHWIALATSLVTGSVSEFSVRFPSALTSACAVALTFFVATVLLDLGAATLIILLLCTSFEWMRSSSLGRVDMVLALFTGVALLLIYRVLNNTGPRAKPRALLVTALAVALAAAALTKGPAGLGIPLIIGGAMMAVLAVVDRAAFNKSLGQTVVILSLAGALALALCSVWYYQAYLIGGEEFLRVQIMRENVARLLGTESYEAETGHHAPFYYGVVLLFAGLLPWSPLLPVGAVILWKRRRDLLLLEFRPQLFALLWCAVFFGIITVSGSKRTVYFLPAYPAAVFLLVWALEGVKKLRWVDNISRGVTALLALTLSITTILVGLGLSTRFSLPDLLHLSERSRHEFEIVWRVLTQSITTLGLMALASAIAIFAVFKSRGNLRFGLSISALSLVLVVYEINSYVYPALAAEKSPREFMAEVTNAIPEGTPLFQYRDNLYTSMFYARRNLQFTADLAEVKNLPLAYVLVEKGYLTKVQEALPGSTIALESSGRVSDGRDGLALIRYTSAEAPK